MIRQKILLAMIFSGFFMSSLSAETVSVPAAPTGPASGYVKVVYTFTTTGGSVSSNGHPVEYRFNWDNGNYSEWGTSLTASTLGGAVPTYTTGGTVNVTVQARCAIDTDVVSESTQFAFLVQECQFYNLTKKITTFYPVDTKGWVNATEVQKIITYINMYRLSTSIWAVLPTRPNYMAGFNLDTSAPAIKASDVAILVDYMNYARLATSIGAVDCREKS